MTDEQRSDDDQAWFEYHARGINRPVKIAEALFGVIREGTYDLDRMREFITPESIATWGDFSAYTQIFKFIPIPRLARIRTRRLARLTWSTSR